MVDLKQELPSSWRDVAQQFECSFVDDLVPTLQCMTDHSLNRRGRCLFRRRCRARDRPSGDFTRKCRSSMQPYQQYAVISL